MKRCTALTKLTFPMAIVHFWLSVSGCSSTYQLSSSAYDDMSIQLDGADQSIVMKDGRELYVNRLKLLGDSVAWVDGLTGEQRKEGKDQVLKIILTKRDHLVGALEGAGVCLVAGALAGVAAVPKHESEYTLLYMMYFGGIGAGAGLLLGAVLGHRDNFEFTKMGEPRTVVGYPQPGILVESSSDSMDVLFLKNGDTIRGTIVAQAGEGPTLQYIAVRDTEGRTWTIYASEIRRVARAKK